MESLHSFLRRHWDDEPLDVPRRTERAYKSDPLQTLRARSRVRGRRVSVWSACVFSAAFPRQGGTRCLGRIMESPHDFDAVHWDHEPVWVVPSVWCPAFRRPGPAKAGTPNRRFMESLLGLATVHFGPEPVRIPLSRPSATLSPAKSGGEGRERGWFMEKVRTRTRCLLAIGMSAIVQLAGGDCAENPQTTGLHVGAAAV